MRRSNVKRAGAGPILDSMPISAETLRLHLDYTAWASNRLLDAAAGLSLEERERDFGTADKSVVGTLVHVFGADRIWLARVQGAENGRPGPEYRDLNVLRPAWQTVVEGWKSWARPLGDEDFLREVAYRDLQGNPWRTPLWQIILHVVNHGTHHRGQAAGFLRAMGRTPPPLDLIAYYRSLGSAAGAP